MISISSVLMTHKSLSSPPLSAILHNIIFLKHVSGSGGHMQYAKGDNDLQVDCRQCRPGERISRRNAVKPIPHHTNYDFSAQAQAPLSNSHATPRSTLRRFPDVTS